MHIAMLGTRGVPAAYGGFETAVEEVGARLVERGHAVTVYCRSQERDPPSEHLGMQLAHRPFIRHRAMETLSHTTASVAHLARSRRSERPDVAIVFNLGNAPVLPLLRALRIPTVVHVDGLEWKRAKWEGVGARFYKRAEAYAARTSLPLIADSKGIAEYFSETYNRKCEVITYGAPVLFPDSSRISEFGLSTSRYHLAVARMEPENNLHLIVSGFLRSRSVDPLVVVGDVPYASAYASHIAALAEDDRIHLVGSVWDQELLNQLYANASSYLHGHSVGGTNPSLLRALGCGAPVSALDVNFNREVARASALYFTNEDEVAAAVDVVDLDPAAARRRADHGRQDVAARYRWDDVAASYERLLKRTAAQ
jgi:glycosyltransferase involved in cell wall biosynthesis